MSDTKLARRLRLDQTPAERKFWEILYPFRQAGHHVRRQSPIGPYIVDFACKRAKLIFEIDGDSQYLPGAAAKDLERTAYLVSRGHRVIRFTNVEVLGTPEGIYLELVRLLGDPGTPS
jgi:very-short-patch-repair endonuclease